MNHAPILETISLSKSFPGVQALLNVDFRLLPGEVHTLMGQNGAGKSTLINVLTGVHEHDAGEIRLGGEAVKFSAPIEAEAAGIRTLYQEVNLCPNLSVAENVFAGRQPKRRGAIDWGSIHARARDALTALNVHVDVTKSLDTYPIAVQQMVAIARALSVDARVLILDEPTSSLDDGEVTQLFNVLRQLRDAGLAILFVTHFLEQTYAISDRITVMRNGEREGEYLAGDLPVEQLVSKMVGHERMKGRLQRTSSDAPTLSDAPTPSNTPMSSNAVEPYDTPRPSAEGSAASTPSPAASTTAAPPVASAATTIDASPTTASVAPFLEMQGVGRRGLINPIDLDVQSGEILGLAGLLGSGRTETAQLVFGAERADAGTVKIQGKTVSLRSPRDAVRQGIGYCPEDRKREGIVADLSIRENIILALQARRGWWRAIGFTKQREIADRYIGQLGIKARDAEQPIGLLSGGNQQKVLLARWLATEPQMLVLDEPTRGIDVAAKFEIMDRIRELCAKGLAILFISSEVSEVVRVSHRITVLRDRRKVAEIQGQASEDQIYRLIAGGNE